MTQYRTTLQLSPEDAAYIAGLIDGEGTITLSRKHRSENRQLAVSISSTERVMLNFVLDRAGVGKITNKRASKENHTPSFTYAVYNRQALQLLEQLQPFLKSYKARRSALALKEYISVTPRNGKYSAELMIARKAFEEKFLSLKPE